MPYITNLRLDPFERTGWPMDGTKEGAQQYFDWFKYQFWRFVFVQQLRSPYWICVCSASVDGRPKRIWRTTKIRIKPLKGDRKADGSPVTARDLRARAEQLAEGRTPQTVDQLVRKILASPFTLAVKLGMLDSNPLAHLPPLKSTRMEKGVFSAEEIAKLVECASGDWKGLILAGYYTGGRLSDLARLTWANVDLVDKTISFMQKKTEGKSARAKLKIPIHPELERYLLSGPISDRPGAPVFPELYDKPGTGRSGMSTQFKRIMQAAGVEAGIGRLRAGKKGRSFSWRSFHSLRHSFISALANSGVSSELRQRLSGHASEEMHAIYSHHELETMRRAVAVIPRLPGK